MQPTPPDPARRPARGRCGRRDGRRALRARAVLGVARQAGADHRAFPAGGGTDAFARPLAAQFAEQTKQQLVIDNKGGAGGTVGATLASRGTGRLQLLHGRRAPHHRPSIYPRLDYDLQKDLIPISLVARVPQVIVVNPTHSRQGLQGVPGAGEGQPRQVQLRLGRQRHLAPPGRRAVQAADQDLHHAHPLPRRRPGLQDLITGSADLMFDGLGSSAAHIKGGRIKGLLVAGNKRVAAFPDIPAAPSWACRTTP